MKDMSDRTTKSFLIISSVFFLFILSPTISLAGKCTIPRVYDGDTIKTPGCDITIKVTLVGIDGPEVSHGKCKSGQAYGQSAKKFLAESVLNRTVDVKRYGFGAFNLILDAKSLNGENINLEKIKIVLAQVSPLVRNRRAFLFLLQ
jgi:endonuclease YncB( thermonuclease family)